MFCCKLHTQVASEIREQFCNDVDVTNLRAKARRLLKTKRVDSLGYHSSAEDADACEVDDHVLTPQLHGSHHDLVRSGSVQKHGTLRQSSLFDTMLPPLSSTEIAGVQHAIVRLVSEANVSKSIVTHPAFHSLIDAVRPAHPVTFPVLAY